MPKTRINEDNWLTLTIEHLETARDLYEDREQIEPLKEVEKLITYLNKTN